MAALKIQTLLIGLLLCASIAGASCGPSGAGTATPAGGTSGEGQPSAGSAGAVGGDAGSAALGVGGAGAGGDGGAGGSAGHGGTSAVGGAPSDAGAGGVGGHAGTGGSDDVGAGIGGASADAGASPTFHVFLLLGQSNMAGYPKALDADKVDDARIQVLGYDDCAATGRKKDTWDIASPPLHECWNGAIGPADYFAKTLIEELPAGDTIGLVPCAISGERIETFLKDGGAKYGWIIERARLAQEAGGVIEGLLFHQGESNNGDPSWPGKVRTLVDDLRADLELGDVPFLAGELAYDGGCAGHNTLVNMLPGIITNAYVVSASGLALDPADTAWHLHFGHDAQVAFGERYAAKLIEARGSTR